MVEDIKRLCAINSERSEYVEGAPFGDGPRKALVLALDIAEKEVIHEYIKRFTAGRGIVILVTHDEGELNLCDRYYILKDGVLNDYRFDGNIKNLAKLIGD